MIGAIIGDIVGSIYEWDNHRSKDFKFFGDKCFFTDDSVMTIAIAKAILDCNGDINKLHDFTISNMKQIGRKYPSCGYGLRFFNWIFRDNSEPYNSWGNGSAMRVSAVGFVCKSIEEAKEMSRIVTEVTHNHPEGLKGAEATAVAIYMARTGSSINDIKKYIIDNYYNINFTLDKIRNTYKYNESCQDTVPQALEAFFESVSFEDAIRNAISIGGDSDTLACITGGIAEAYYGVPNDIKEEGLKFLDSYLLSIYKNFEKKYIL